MNANNLDVESFDSEIAAPQRTSILAILSLVCSLICLIPGTGVLATIFGISALIGIRGSRGRVGGTGLAIAGLIVGLLFTMVWIGIAVGLTSAWRGFQDKITGPMNQAIVAFDAGDSSKLRASLSPSVSATISDQRLNDFRSAYQADLGSYKGIPTSFIEFVSAYGAVGASMQNLKGRQDILPIPVNFDKGPAILVYCMDRNVQPTKASDGSINFPITNVIIYTSSGGQYALVPGDGAPSVPPAPAAPAAPPTDKPADGPAKEGDK